MPWGGNSTKAILHVDGDAFFAACEVAKNPKLRGKPVITGKERGIVSAATYEAKRLGITRGTRLSDVKKICPEAIILPSDYETYSIYSRRMYEIVRRYTPEVEEYGIDECFAELTGMRRMNHMSYVEMSRHIKADLRRELDMTFSLGLGPTKVLAKLGSKFQKPDGFTVITNENKNSYLAKTPLEHVWGIGFNTTMYLRKYGMMSALDFAHKEEGWVKEMVSKPFYEIWHELRGNSVLPLILEQKDTYQSISKTKTFTPPTTNAAFIYSQLSKNVENACIKARRYNLAAGEAYFFLKTQQCTYHGTELRLARPTHFPEEILGVAKERFAQIYKKGRLYRATGIILHTLREAGVVQLDLFGGHQRTEALEKVYKNIDELSKKYGKHAVFLGSSAAAMRYGAHLGERGDTPERTKNLFKGESARRRLPLPHLGDVS